MNTTARAVTKTWDGGAGTTNWSDANNWNPDGIPTSTDDVILDNSSVSGNYTVILDGATARSCRSLQIGYSGNTNTIGLTLNGTTGSLLTVGGSATNDLIIHDGGLLTNNGNPGSGTRTIVFNSSSDVWQMLGTGKYIHNQTTGLFPNSSSSTITRSFASTSTFEYQTTNGFSASITYGNLVLNASAGTFNPSMTNMTINGDLTVQAGTWRGATSSAPTHTIGGSIVISGGTFTGTDGSGSPTYNVSASLNQTNGTYQATSNTGTPTVNFSGTGNINLAGTVSNSQHIINVNGTITLQSNLPVASGGSVTVNGTLNCGTNNVTGAGNFTLASGGTLGIGSTAGITSSGATGNIQVTGTRSFNTAASYTYNGSAAQVTGSGLPSTINNLTINNSAGVTLTNSVSVTGTLALTNGDLITGSNMLTQNGDSTGSGDVVGIVRRADCCATTKKFGNPNVQITVSSGAAPNPMDVTLAKSAPSTFTNAITRKYTLTDAGSITATVRLRYLDSELNGNTEASLDLFRFNGATWTQQPKTASDTTANWVEKNNVTAFSDWTLSSVSATTVRITALAAQSTKNRVLVHWETVSEVDDLGFNMLRSTSREGPFVPLNADLLPAQASGSLSGAAYSFADSEVVSGATYFYLLEVVTFDGRRVPFGPASVQFRGFDERRPAHPASRANRKAVDQPSRGASGGSEILEPVPMAWAVPKGPLTLVRRLIAENRMADDRESRRDE
jgi:hypothetical protein